MNQGVSKLAKLLASDELKKRKLGYKFACDLMKLQPGSNDAQLSYIDVLGVCKGLYFSLWMQDKLLLQEEAVARIVKLIRIIENREVRSMYVKAMFSTLAKEWEGLDFWRQDKFMMLVRDFLVQCITSVKKRTLGPEILASAVFDSILNADINSAVELKLHLIVVLKEEILKAGEIPSLVNAFFKHIIQIVPRMQRGGAYATDMVTLLNFLAKEIGKYPKYPFGKISEDLLMLSTKFPLYRKTFLRVSKLLHKTESIAARLRVQEVEKATKNGESNSSNVNGEVVSSDPVSESIASEISPIKTIPLNGQAIENNVESAPVNYITNVSPNTAKASKKSRKRKLTEEGAQTPAVLIPKKKRLKEEHTEVNNDSKANNSDKPVKVEAVPTKEEVEDIGVTNGFTSPGGELSHNEFLAPAIIQQFDLSVLDNADQASPIKRVSFGKVMYRKYLSTKAIKPTPIPTASPPTRGILRR